MWWTWHTWGRWCAEGLYKPEYTDSYITAQMTRFIWGMILAHMKSHNKFKTLLAITCVCVSVCVLARVGEGDGCRHSLSLCDLNMIRIHAIKLKITLNSQVLLKKIKQIHYFLLVCWLCSWCSRFKSGRFAYHSQWYPCILIWSKYWGKEAAMANQKPKYNLSTIFFYFVPCSDRTHSE